MKKAFKEFFGKHHAKHSEDPEPTPAPTVEQPVEPASVQTSTCQSSPNTEAEAARGPKDASDAASDSSVIAVAEHCPPAMVTDKWSLSAFEIRSKMYAGHISSVYRAVHRKSNITVGLKLYKRSSLNDMERHQIAREIWLHIQLAHPSIIALYAAWKDKDYIYLVMEWAPEGNVFTFLQQKGGVLPESVAVPMLLVPTLSALAYIHQLGMIHRDVKPENILLTTSYQIKLADFGLSIHSNYEVANTRLGTVDYLAPEILDCPVKHHPGDHKANPVKWYTNKVDVWSVGIFAYELLVGSTPFEAMHPQQTLIKIRTQEVQYPGHLSPGAVAFMRQALVRDPTRRATMAQLLAHPWLINYTRQAAGWQGRGRSSAVDTLLGSPSRCLSLASGPGGVRGGSCSAHLPGGLAPAAEGAHNSCPQLAGEVGQAYSSKGVVSTGEDLNAPADVWRIMSHRSACGGSYQQQGQQGHQPHQHSNLAQQNQQHQQQQAAAGGLGRGDSQDMDCA